jgi:hypothetical protein
VLFDTAYMARGWLDASGSTVKAMEPEDGQAPVQL